MKIAMLLLTIIFIYVSIRYILLRRSVRDTKRQLDDILQALDENQIVRLPNPDKDMEELQQSVNKALYEVRKERISYEKREQQFQRQIANISHDLRTPLTSILGYLKIMDTSYMNKEEQEDLQVVKKKAETLQELIRQFYDFSRLTAGEYNLRMEVLDSARMLREMLMEEYQEFSRKGLEMEVELPEQPMWVQGDAEAMQRVFQNLLQNAGRYAKSSLRITMQNEKEYIQIVFGNDTEKISSVEAERMFERFYTADQSRNTGATGLGLTIAREFVEQMGGSIRAEQDGDEWLELIVELPASRI